MEQYIPNIITALVSIIISVTALIIGYKHNNRVIKASKENLDRQLKVQLATTIEKEWIHNVRDELATIINQAFYVANGFIKSEENIDDDRVEKFINSVNALKLLLDNNNQLERDLNSAITKLANVVTSLKVNDDLGAVTIQSNIVIVAAHKFFNSRKT
jgi:Mg2+ and Co2+ transporter CorA